MERTKWHSLEKGRHSLLERLLKQKIKSLYRFCKKHGLDYCDLYILTTEGTTALNIRAKKNGEVIVNGYALMR